MIKEKPMKLAASLIESELNIDFILNSYQNYQEDDENSVFKQ